MRRVENKERAKLYLFLAHLANCMEYFEIIIGRLENMDYDLIQHDMDRFRQAIARFSNEIDEYYKKVENHEVIQD